jgi:hypothetical protein
MNQLGILVLVQVGSAKKVPDLAEAASCLRVSLIPGTAVSKTLKRIILWVSILQSIPWREAALTTFLNTLHSVHFLVFGIIAVLVLKSRKKEKK